MNPSIGDGESEVFWPLKPEAICGRPVQTRPAYPQARVLDHPTALLETEDVATERRRCQLCIRLYSRASERQGLPTLRGGVRLPVG